MAAKRRRDWLEPETSAPEPPAVRPAVSNEPLMTVASWGRGRADVLSQVFITDLSRGRAEKKTRAQWDAAFQVWLAQPRP